MTVPDLLLAFMAAAIAVAGFAGIVALIDRGHARVAPELASFRVRWLVYSAAWTIVLAVAPMLAILSNAPHGVWQYGCIIQAACLFAFMFATTYNVQRFRRGRAQGIRMGGAYVMLFVAIAVIAMLVFGAAGYISASGAYATGVFWFLLSALLNFMRLVFTLDDAWRNAARREMLATVATAPEKLPEPVKPPEAESGSQLEPKPAESIGTLR
jgi:uncharacterized membrane protein